MPFKDNIPQPTDKLRDSQNDILNNFTSLQVAFDENHYTFDDADAGKHAHVAFPNQVADPAAVVTEMQMYSKISALSTFSELFIRRGSGTVVEFTSAFRNIDGWTRLPSGILLKWGLDAANGATTMVYPVGANTPAFTAVYSIMLTVTNPAPGVDVDEALRVIDLSNPLQFDLYASFRTSTGANTVGFNYLAIGI